MAIGSARYDAITAAANSAKAHHYLHSIDNVLDVLDDAGRLNPTPPSRQLGRSEGDHPRRSHGVGESQVGKKCAVERAEVKRSAVV